MGKREQQIVKKVEQGEIIASRGIQEVEIEYKGIKYILNNNSGKYSRIFDKKYAGPKPTTKQKMAFYDSFGGLILIAQNRAELATGYFWPPYKKQLENRERLRNSLHRVREFTSHPVVAPLIIAIIAGIIFYLLGIDIRSFV